MKHSVLFPRICIDMTMLVIFSCMVLPILPGQSKDQEELRVWMVPGVEQGAEFYFSPDGKRLIGNAKVGNDTVHHVYTIGIDGKGLLCINSTGEDACSFY